MRIAPILQDLAPQNLTVYRSERYDGGGFSVSIHDFPGGDQDTILQVYHQIKGLYDVWLYMQDGPDYALLKSQIEQKFNRPEFLKLAQQMGQVAQVNQIASPMLRKVIHDIRGGGLTILVGCAQLLALFPEDESLVTQAVFTARDHAKLMRNAIYDLDPVVTQADERLKIHPIDDFVYKWQDSSFQVHNKSVQVVVRCTFSGNITSRCLETSAIDRILYNYINNAARFSHDNKVQLSIFPVGDGLVRWVVRNALSQNQLAWLQETVGTNFGILFKGGLTHGGQGIGLSNCADFVAASFGLEPDEAIKQAYLGAKVRNTHYYAWFHWPTYTPSSPDEPVCDCGH
jgi:K+-sensing histidine kinase KdpD